MTKAMINKHMTVIGKVGVCNINTGLFRLQDSLNYLGTVDPRLSGPRLSGPRLSGTLIIWHHFRVNLLIDFAVLLIALISSHVYFNLQLHFLTSSCIFFYF